MLSAGRTLWDVGYDFYSYFCPYSGTEDQFLINPYGLFFDEITASSLVKVDIDGNILDETDFHINPAGYTIHSAVMVRVMTLTAYCIHIQRRGWLFISETWPASMTQHALMFYQRLAYHGYVGIALNLDERERLVRDLGEGNIAMLLRNHGLLTVGASISEAFRRIFYLEKDCQAQIQALSGGQS